MYPLEQCFTAVRSWFDARYTETEHVFGFGAVEQYQENAYARVAWTPGSPGKVMYSQTRPLQIDEENPLTFAKQFELFTVTLSAFDRFAPEDKFAQYSAIWLLHQQFRNAINDSNLPITVATADWVVNSKMFQHGLALRVTCGVEVLINLIVDPDTEVFPWSAYTRVHNSDVFVESIDFPLES